MSGASHLLGRPLSDTAPNDGDMLAWNDTDGVWEPVSAGTPSPHATTHQSGGSDSIKLDDLAAPDDNTDLNASAAKHGLLKKLPNLTYQFLDGRGNWNIPFRRMSQEIDWRDDFVGGTAASGYLGDNGWTLTVSGTGAAGTSVAGEASHPGIYRVTPGTTTTGYAGIYTVTVQTKVVPAAGTAFEIGIKIGTLSTAGDEYVLRIGLGDSINASAHTVGVWFEYDRLNYGANWQRCTVDGGAITRADTGIAVATGWVRLRCEIASGAAEFFINDVSGGTNKSAVPNASNCSPNYLVNKTAGTTALYFYIDYYHLYMDLTASPR